MQFSHLFWAAAGLLALSTLSYASTSACNPTSKTTCALPFPSNVWAVDDASSATGVRLQVSNDSIRPELLAQLPANDGYTPARIFNGSSGFSAASSVLFEFDTPPNSDELPSDGGNAVIAWNVTTQSRIDVLTRINTYARSKKVSAPSNILQIFPRDRWSFGHTVLVAVTDQFSVGDNDRISSSCTDNSDYCNKLIAAINNAGLNPSQVRNATLFTVRERNEVLKPIRDTINTVWNNNHPVRKLFTIYNYSGIGPVAAWVKGQVRVDSYRTNNGTGPVDFNMTPVQQWLDFNLTLPQSAKQGNTPVALYAHGIIASKDTDIFVSNSNASMGIATFSINFPNHGSRAKTDGGSVTENLKTEDIGTLAGMINHNAIDFASAHRALQTALAELDVVGQPNWFRWCSLCGDGVPDMNTSEILMQGTSLGGVLGSTYAALGHDIKAAAFQVTGVGVTGILSQSIFWDGMFSQLVPKAATGAEALMLLAAVQHTFDYGDPINHIDLLRYPDTPRAPRPTFITSGQNDVMVVNSGSVALARIMNMPLVGEKLYDIPGVTEASDYDNGYGIRHYRSIAPVPIDAVAGIGAHLSFIDPKATKDQKAWTKRFFLEQ